MTLLQVGHSTMALLLFGEIPSQGGPTGMKPTPIGRRQWEEFSTRSYDPFPDESLPHRFTDWSNLLLGRSYGAKTHCN